MQPMLESGYIGSRTKYEGYVPETPQEQIQKEPPAEPPLLKHHRKKMKKPSSNIHCVILIDLFFIPTLECV